MQSSAKLFSEKKVAKKIKNLLLNNLKFKKLISMEEYMNLYWVNNRNLFNFRNRTKIKNSNYTKIYNVNIIWFSLNKLKKKFPIDLFAKPKAQDKKSSSIWLMYIL